MFLMASLLCLDRSTSQGSHNLYLQCYQESQNVDSLFLFANLAYLDFTLLRNNPPPFGKPASVQNFCLDESGPFPFELVSVSSFIVRIPVIKLIKNYLCLKTSKSLKQINNTYQTHFGGGVPTQVRFFRGDCLRGGKSMLQLR